MVYRLHPTVHLGLLIVAVILLAIFGCIGAGWFSSSHPDVFLGFGLTFFAASFL